jgi:hypothetical protein
MIVSYATQRLALTGGMIQTILFDLGLARARLLRRCKRIEEDFGLARESP